MQDQKNMTQAERQQQTAAILGVGAASLGLTLAVTEQPAQAAGGVDDVAGAVTSLGTLAASALAVALVPFGLFFAFKIVRKVMSGA